MKQITTLSLMFLISSFFINAQTIITVDNSVGANAEYSDLQLAIDEAASGDIIYVHPSELTYGEIIVNKSINLIGFGHSNTLRNTIIEEIVLEDNASNSRFTGLYITDRIDCQNSILQIQDIIIENCRVNNRIDFGSFTQDEGVNNVIIRGSVTGTIMGNATDLIITNNIIRSRIIVDENYNSITIRNNIFFRATSGVQVPATNAGNANGSIILQNCIFYDDRGPSDTNNNSPGVIFENCLSYNQGTGNVDLMEGSNNLDNVDPLFVNVNNDDFEAALDDYNLQAGSPAIGSGAGGLDMGLYDNINFVFNNSGFTAGIPSVSITAITEQVAPGGTIEVTIESSSN
ncbi:MAG: hypothetical protein AB8B52_04290 [Winogradskyella sp.]|uniref:hypothetical protein n=1 Tax=Winogradskyella sp. TaxID=1883156 RepID=UPI00385C0A91